MSKLSKSIIAGMAVVIAALVITVWVRVSQTNGDPVLGGKKVTEVLITPNGFSPASVTVAQGDIVRWVNKDTKAHWPASDPHPTHTNYPGFDALKGIAPGQSWQFQFDRIGDWGYHDHLIPAKEGRVIVTAASGALAPSTTIDSNSADIAHLKAATSQDQKAQIVRAMAEKFGTLETLAMMRDAGLPFTGETHLLVHEIGNVAYEKYGDQALLHCDESFLAACYHGVILNELGDHGMDGLTTMLQQCQSQGPALLAQCSHAAGHGFLAWKDYHVLDALPYCDKLNEMNPSVPAFNCYDGVFMENIFGVHDGAPSPNRLFNPSDPNYPCDAVPEKYQGGCWADQATMMYTIFQGDLRKVAQGCDAVTNAQYRDICYNNFAREIHPITQGNATKAVELCKNATGAVRQDQCLIDIVSAAFSVGDTKVMPYALCKSVSGSAKKDECYQVLYANIKTYGKSSADYKQMCGYILEAARKTACLAQFN